MPPPDFIKEPPLVLVVDDEAQVRRLICVALERAGFAAIEAENGAIALKHFHLLRPDLVLLDILMPELDGYATCAELRRAPGGDYVPILMMTGLDDTESINRAYEAGATDFIAKPFNWTMLEYRVRYMVRSGRIFTELQNSEKRLAYAQQVAHLGYWQWRPEEDAFGCSPETCRLLGLAAGAGSVNYATFLSYVHPADRPLIQELFNAAAMTGKSFSLDCRIVPPDRGTRIFHLQGEGTPKGEANPREINGTVQDITERKLAEEQLRTAHNYLENVIENSPDPFGIVDAEGKFTRWSGLAETAFGYTFAELKAKKFSDLYARKDDLDKLLYELRRAGAVKNYEIDMKVKDGRIVPFSLSIRMLRDRQGKVSGSICVARDMTEIKNNLQEIETSNAHLKNLVSELGRRNREITLLNEMSELLQSCLESKEAHAIITRFAPKLFEADAGAYFIIDTARNLVEAAAAWGVADIGEQSFPPSDCWALRRGRMYFQENTSPGMRCRHLAHAPEGAHICIPFLAHGETKGMLLLQLNRGGAPLPRESLQQLAAAVSGHIALALANIKLRDTLRHQVLHDPLTGLYNRRYLEEALLRELPRLARKGAPLGLIILTVDQDREFHDAFGHDAGDTLAQVVGEFLGRRTLPGHIPCRYGGMEFVVLLPEASLEATRKQAEELRRGLAALPVYHKGGNLGKIAVSVGVAGFPEHGVTGGELLNAAVGAMQGGKFKSRDQVVLACLLPGSDAAEAN